ANVSMGFRVRASRLFVLSIQRAAETVGDSRAKRGPRELYGFDWLGISANSRGSPSSGRTRCFYEPHQLASSLHTCYTNVMNGFATHWMLRGATVSNHCRRSSVNPVWRHLNAGYPPEGGGDTGSSESAGRHGTRNK